MHSGHSWNRYVTCISMCMLKASLRLHACEQTPPIRTATCTYARSDTCGSGAAMLHAAVAREAHRRPQHYNFYFQRIQAAGRQQVLGQAQGAAGGQDATLCHARTWRHNDNCFGVPSLSLQTSGILVTYMMIYFRSCVGTIGVFFFLDRPHHPSPVTQYTFVCL
jgi:hypothetical protein